MTTDPSRPKSLAATLGALFAAVIILAGCGNEADTTLSLPDDVETETTGEVTTPPSSDDVASPGTDDNEAEPADPEPTPDEPAAGDDIFTPRTVQFDPDNPPDQSELEDLAFDAVKADFENSFWCWANTEICDVEKHLGPGVVHTRLSQLKTDLETYRSEGGIYQAGDLDNIYPVEVLASSEFLYEVGTNNEWRGLAEVTACEVYNGTFFIPNDDGTPKEVLNDEQAGAITNFSVWQDREGVLRVASKRFEEQGGVEICDPYKG
jgi:hypothetical protein